MQLLLSAWLLSTAPQKNKAMLTEALPTAATACQRQTIRGSAADPSYEVRDSFTPSEYNAVIDNVTGRRVVAAITNVKDQKVSKLRLRIAGTAPGAGE